MRPKRGGRERVSVRPIKAPSPPLDVVRELLRAANLPFEDVTADPDLHFFGSRQGGQWRGVVGVQLIDAAALLRSLAVASVARGRGTGRELVAMAEAFARNAGRRDVYLLTTDAADFFVRLGYQVIDRAQAPQPLRTTQQFAQLCPASARLLHKTLL